MLGRRLAYANAGSALPYLSAEVTPREGEGYGKVLKDRANDWFVKRPYKGLGALGSIFGAISGIAFGPIGVLIMAGIGYGVSAGAGGVAYWGWARGKRDKTNPKFDVFDKDGRSFGKWLMDYERNNNELSKEREAKERGTVPVPASNKLQLPQAYVLA